LDAETDAGSARIKLGIASCRGSAFGGRQPRSAKRTA